MHQDTSQSIFYYYSQTSSMWEQLFVANPLLLYPEDIELLVKYRDCCRFMHFMMGLHEDFESTRASLFSWSPTHSLDVAVKELISKKNH